MRISGKILPVSAVLASVVFAVMHWITLPELRSIAGGLAIFDLMPGGYDIDYARMLLGALEEQGRAYYLYRQIPLDMLFPLLYAPALALLIRWLLALLGDEQSPWRFASWVAVAAAAADYLENLCTTLLLVQYPDLSGWVVEAGSAATIGKNLLLTLYLVAFMALLFMVGRRSFQVVKD